jgi:HAD superfamily hydrolase (TIGR01509 family)
MIKAIIFDCFGVLASEELTPFREKYFGDNRQLFNRVTEMIRQTTAGALRYDEFIKTVAKLADISEQDTQNQIEGNRPNVALFAFIATVLKPSYKIGLLSNVARNRLSEMFSPVQLSLFSGIGLSYEMGVVKPEAKAYTMIADRMGVKPNECVFIDDQLKYCEGAMAIGMQAIRYRSLRQLEDDLKGLGID